jgi:dihydroorotate dehydrogenase
MDLYSVIKPVLWRLDPERAHHLALWALSRNLVATSAGSDDPRLSVEALGRRFANPIGLAAGFDKDAKVWRQTSRLGFGFVEVGSVTPLPQAGNPQPRLFRLERNRAIINRMGFNNGGVEAMAQLLAAERSQPGAAGIVLGINLGKNKETEDAAADYEIGARRLGPFADYMVINVSSPNTQGLRALQGKVPLSALIARTHRALTESCGAKAPPLLLKIAPDLTDQDVADIAEVALEGSLAGLIATNTTIGRPQGLDPRAERGGLSGRPLFRTSTQVLRAFYRLTAGKLPIVGVGGIASGADAYAKIRAGATLVQLYSALVFEGPGLVRRIKRDLLLCLERDGLRSIGEAVGLDHQ